MSTGLSQVGLSLTVITRVQWYSPLERHPDFDHAECKWVLLRRFSGSEVKGQPDKYIGRGIQFDSVALHSCCNNAFTDVESRYWL